MVQGQAFADLAEGVFLVYKPSGAGGGRDARRRTYCRRRPSTSLLKPGIIGNYHHISREYLPLYLNEFSYRFNNRKNPDIFDAIIAGC